MIQGNYKPFFHRIIYTANKDSTEHPKEVL
jgi:hypothetical protein